MSSFFFEYFLNLWQNSDPGSFVLSPPSPEISDLSKDPWFPLVEKSTQFWECPHHF